MCSTKIWRLADFEVVNRFGKTTSKQERRGTQIFTFFQHEIAEGICDDVVTGSLEFGMLALFTSY
jgi:hypothetical protein